MEFNFLFPTLKQLSILRICQHWSDYNLGFFSEIRKESTIASEYLFPLFSDYNYMIDRLSIPAELKTSLSEALYGICQQIRIWFKSYHRYRSVEKFYFDSFGRFDVDKTVEHFYKKQVAAREDLYFLHELLSEAAKRAWISEIDVVLRKMVSVCIQPLDVLLEGPHYHHENRKEGMRYTFRRNLDSKNSGKVNFLTSFASNYVSISTNEKGLVVTLIPLCESLKVFEERLLLGLFRKQVNIKRLIQCLFSQKCVPTSHVLEILTRIKNLEGKSWISYVETDTYLRSYMQQLLYRSLTWPFTMFLAPVFQLLYPQLDTERCLVLLSNILKTVLIQQWCGVLQGDILREFWSNMPISIKRDIAVNYKQHIDDILKVLREKISHKQTIFICHAIMTELDNLDTSNGSRLRRKRKHE